VNGSCEHGNELSGSIKVWEVLEELHSWRLLEKGSAPRVSGKQTPAVHAVSGLIDNENYYNDNNFNKGEHTFLCGVS
jgi:hypothetical protein